MNVLIGIAIFYSFSVLTTISLLQLVVGVFKKGTVLLNLDGGEQGISLFGRSLLVVWANTFPDNALGSSILSILIEGVGQLFCWSGVTPAS